MPELTDYCYPLADVLHLTKKKDRCQGLQYSEGNGGAGLGIRQRVMVPRQVETAAGRDGLDGLKLVVRQFRPEYAPGSNAGTMESIIRIVHAVSSEHRPQTALVETAVVGHERQSSDKWSGLLPHLWKYRSLSGILPRKAVDAGVPVAIILRLGTDEAVEAVTAPYWPSRNLLLRNLS